MDDDEQGEIEDWKACYEISLIFQARPSPWQKCINCSKVNRYAGDVFRSTFWTATRCHAGHSQARPEETRGGTNTPQLGVCGSCDKDYVFNVVKGKLTCRRDNCRRVVRVNKAAVRSVLSAPADQDLLLKFLACVDKYNVYECAIHCDRSTFDEGTAPPTSECDHDRQVCNDCLKSLFESSIRGGRLKELACPDVQCRKQVTVQLVRQLISPACAKIYFKKLAFEAMADDPNFRWCVCGHGQIHPAGEAAPEWNCLACKQRHCFVCKDDDEGDAPCEHLAGLDRARRQQKDELKKQALQALERHQRDGREQTNTRATKEEIARSTKRCPRAGCQIPIFRDDGCAHMTCKKCDADFCWSCKVIWKRTGKNLTVLHLDTCRIGTKRRTALRSLDKRGYGKDWNVDRGYDTSLDSDLWLISSQQ
ncbi:hypothetical protein GQ53DRAFT_842164 [Thozetella sp. PMI_491]|nr:hypothetical protein GQ53DRAFT_842164 [Thozetella sp. PMI_491]